MYTLLGSKERTKEDFEGLCGLVNERFREELGGRLVKVETVRTVRGSEMSGVVIGMVR